MISRNGSGLREVQASEAKTHLPRLRDEVELGETIIITRQWLCHRAGAATGQPPPS
jgi:hypothetical protein